MAGDTGDFVDEGLSKVAPVYDADGASVSLYAQWKLSLLVSAGYSHSLLAVKGGGVWAWGYNDDGTVYRWGRVSAQNGSSSNQANPSRIASLSGVVAIAAGKLHGLALSSDGSVYAWGYNSNGQLGISTATANTATPQALTLSAAVALSSSTSHDQALLSTGGARGWGNNGSGQLGGGTSGGNAITPVAVSDLSGAIAVGTGANHSLALLSDGTVRAWGSNGAGQLGCGSAPTSALQPIAVSGLSGIAGIAAGYDHNLAVGSDNSVWAWGYNNYGQLGVGTTTIATTPLRVNWMNP